MAEFNRLNARGRVIRAGEVAFTFNKGTKDEIVMMTEPNANTTINYTTEQNSTTVIGDDGENLFEFKDTKIHTIAITTELLDPNLFAMLRGEKREVLTDETPIEEVSSIVVGQDKKITLVKEEPTETDTIKKVVDASISYLDGTPFKKAETEPTKAGEFQIDASGKSIAFHEDDIGQHLNCKLKFIATKYARLTGTKGDIAPQIQLQFTTEVIATDKKAKVRRTYTFFNVELDGDIPMNASKDAGSITLTFKTVKTPGCKQMEYTDRIIANNVC